MPLPLRKKRRKGLFRPQMTSAAPKTTAATVPPPVPYLFAVKKMRKKAKKRSGAGHGSNREPGAGACPKEKKTATAKTPRESRTSLLSFPGRGQGEKRKPVPGASA